MSLKIKTIRNLFSLWWFRILFFGISSLLLLPIVFLLEDLIYINLTILSILVFTNILTERFRINSKWYNIGLRLDRRMFSELFTGFVLVLFSFAALIIVSVAIGAGYSYAGFNGTFGYFVSVIMIVFATAASEELIFRGVLFQALIERFGGVTSSILMSLAFSLAHIFNPGVNFLALLNVFLAGILFSVLYLRSLSLWLPISFHFFWNLLTDLMLSSPVSGISFGIGIFHLKLNTIPESLRWIISGYFGIEQGLITSLMLLFVIIISLKKIVPSPYIYSSKFLCRFAESELSYDGKKIHESKHIR